MFESSTINVITRPLPRDQVRSRPGPGKLTFDYIPAEFVIRLLNEAFNYSWCSKILDAQRVENEVVVLLELMVKDFEGVLIYKQQYGAAAVNKDIGDAYKSAASDALKKCATLFGIGLELYDGVSSSGPVPQTTEVVASVPPPGAPRPPGPVRSVVLPAPPKANPFEGAPPSVPQRPVPAVVPAPRAVGIPRPLPLPTAVPAPPAPPAPPVASAPVVPVPRPNPFANAKQAAVGATTGPNPTQFNALTNIATRRTLSQRDLIALAGIVNENGQPTESFDDLTYEQAIKVIKAAQ